MSVELIIALAIAVPIILFPVAFVWYLNMSGIWQAVKLVRENKVARRKGKEVKNAEINMVK